MRGVIPTFSREADGNKPSARAARRHVEQHGIERSVAELGGMLQLTSKLDAPSSGSLSPMPYS